MENLPVEIYTWTILAVIDSAETPFLKPPISQLGLREWAS
ncbi:MAG: hypothetical protein Ct9H300mP11_18990 [Chloroflexota bacterium]|nr:MAG: hypothetical protein Ct9H300mP11_18990 [Chloroflexota bacterium]